MAMTGEGHQAADGTGAALLASSQTAPLARHSRAEQRWYLVVLAGLVAGLGLWYPVLARSSYRGSPDVHATLEVAGALMGLITGYSLVTRFAALGNRFHLFIGLAFFVNGAEDFVHGLLPFEAMHLLADIGHADLDHVIPATDVTGRLLFGLLLLLAIPAGRLLPESARPRQETLLVSIPAILIPALATGAAFQLQLPPVVHPESALPRPLDFVAALILLLALAAFLLEYRRSRDMLLWWIALSIGLNVVGQGMVSFSRALYDPFFDFAHACKVMGYAAPLLGFSLYQIGVIAERQQVERKLRAAHERFAVVLDSIDALIYVADLDSHEILLINRCTRDTFGEITGRLCWQTIQQDQTGPCDFCSNGQLVDAAGRLQGTYAWEQQNTRNQRWYALRDRAIHWVDGRLARITIATDITAGKQAQAERERLIGELESKNAELERFTYTVSHDLKSPLITIAGFVGLLEKDALAGDVTRMRSDIAHIRTAAEQMKELLDDLLELSRIGRIVHPPQVVPVGELAQAAVGLVEGRVRERGVQVLIQPELPAVFVDKARLTEVFLNLVDNAVKFMGDQPEPRVEIGARQEGGEVLCWVRDNGSGIEPRYARKVFGLFERLDQRAEGTGIGLTLAKRIVEEHGGRIWVESEGDKKGSTFFFTVPVRKEGEPS
ncbi:MAG: ATP-binding protein [Thermodesulfobacteriota bacterium]